MLNVITKFNSNYIYMCGFIDPCTHIDCSLVMPDALAAGYTPWGTTTVVGEINDLAAAQRENGVEAIHAYMKDRERLPFRMLCLAPGKGVDGEITARLLQDPDIAGQGENQGIFTLEGQRATLEKVVHNRVNQIYTNGHCEPFASTDEMCPFAICGAGVDHEAWTFEAVFERHRRGIRTSIQYMQGWDQFDLMIREIILNRRLPASNFMFAGDNTYIHDMVDHGILNLMVERAIKLGLSPVTAIKMATFNTAQELGLLQYIGSITPGRYADFSLVADLCSMTPKAVYKGGELVAQNGKLVSPVHINYDYFRTQHWTKGFQTLTVEDGNDLAAIGKAIEAAKADKKRPSFITVKTQIGYGCPAKQGKASAHGEPLSAENVTALRPTLGWDNDQAFEVPAEVYAHYRGLT